MHTHKALHITGEEKDNSLSERNVGMKKISRSHSSSSSLSVGGGSVIYVTLQGVGVFGEDDGALPTAEKYTVNQAGTERVAGWT